jgi:hypothetical protein
MPRCYCWYDDPSSICLLLRCLVGLLFGLLLRYTCCRSGTQMMDTVPLCLELLRIDAACTIGLLFEQALRVPASRPC